MESTKRRFPKVLADEILAALSAVQELDPDEKKELLQRYRRNRTRYIAAWGLLTPDAPVHELEHIPHEWHSKIADLDKAFAKIHSYMGGGAEDYVAADVMKEINRSISRKGRKSNVTNDELGRYLSRRKFEESSDKASIIAAAAAQYNVSPRTIERRIAEIRKRH